MKRKKRKDETNFWPAVVIAVALALIIFLAAGMVAVARAEESAADLAASSSWSSSLERAKRTRPFDGVVGNFWDAHFDRRAVPFHLAAGAAAYLLVQSGADAKIQRWAAGHDRDLSLAWSAPGLAGGFVAPALVPGGMLLSDDPQTQEAGAAAMQAAAVALASSSLLKAITNRKGPEDGKAATDAEARNFRWGFWRQGVSEGFPSGHAATNTAMCAALAAYYPGRPDIRAAACGWAAYVALSAALGDRGGFHWTSDVVTGALMGWAIGDSIGRKFAAKKTGKDDGGFSIAPDFRNNGAEITFRF